MSLHECIIINNFLKEKRFVQRIITHYSYLPLIDKLIVNYETVLLLT